MPCRGTLGRCPYTGARLLSCGGLRFLRSTHTFAGSVFRLHSRPGRFSGQVAPVPTDSRVREQFIRHRLHIGREIRSLRVGQGRTVLREGTIPLDQPVNTQHRPTLQAWEMAPRGVNGGSAS